MTRNPLVAAAVDHTSPFAGTLLLEDGEQLVQAMRSGDWAAGGMAAFSGLADTVAAVSDPIGTLIAVGLGWLIDHVEPLKGWFTDLTGDAAQVDAFARTWGNIQSQLEDASRELRRVLGDVDELAGEAIDAYRRFQLDTARHLMAAGAWAGAFATGLQVASTIVQAVHDLVRDVLSQLVGSAISWAAEAVFSVGLATPWIIEQVSTRVASWVAKVGRFITRLVESLAALRGLLGQLGPLLERAGGLFDTLLRGGDRAAGGVPVPPVHGGADRVGVSARQRVYRFADGTVHDPTTSRARLSAVPDAEPVLVEAATKHEMTMDRLRTLVYDTPVDDLDPADARALIEIRDAVAPPATGEIMQKVLSEHTWSEMRDNHQEWGVRGFVAKAADAQQLLSSADYYHGFGLDYGPGRSMPPEFSDGYGGVADLYAGVC